jgi:phosphoribosylanthranilate isomerase
VTIIKVCGVTTVEDACLAVECGADLVGVNLVPTSPRVLDPVAARAIAEAVRGRAVVVGVVADRPLVELQELRRAARLDQLQLHGSEPPELLEALLPGAYKAIRVGSAEDVELAATYGGEQLLVDAKVSGMLGGTGATFDWRLVRQLATERRLLLAGGLNPDNVARAVAEVRPWGVDVASGVEVPGQPRRKDPDLVRRFVQRVRGAS